MNPEFCSKLIEQFSLVPQTNSNLWLQMALYFNFYYSIVWTIFHFLTISMKVSFCWKCILKLKIEYKSITNSNV